MLLTILTDHYRVINEAVCINLLFFNQRKREYFPGKNAPDARVDLGTDAYEIDPRVRYILSWKTYFPLPFIWGSTHYANAPI